MVISANYSNVTFVDTQNGQAKTKSIQVGSRITLENSETGRTTYEIKEDGIYKNGQKTTSRSINVTLPQLSAVSVWDVNKDGKIDGLDAKENGKKDFYHMETVLDSALASSKSDYHVVPWPEGTCASAEYNNDKEYRFGAYFENAYESDPSRQTKYISLEGPAVVQKEAEKKEAEKIELDKKYEEKHWFRAFLGISRAEYEANHQRDY